MDKTTPFFSIVMPVYGVADYLEQTLQSVAAQTFEDFEVILVDDCSPDDSPKICDAWVKKRRAYDRTASARKRRPQQRTQRRFPACARRVCVLYGFRRRDRCESAGASKSLFGS